LKQKNTIAAADISLFAYCTICSLQQAAETIICAIVVLALGKEQHIDLHIILTS
jgi:hypothetical protein